MRPVGAKASLHISDEPFFRPPQYPACQAGLASPNPSVEGLNRGRGVPTSRPSKVRPTEPVPLRGWPWFLTGGIGLPVVCPHRAMRDVLFARCVATLFKCCCNGVAMVLQRFEGPVGAKAPLHISDDPKKRRTVVRRPRAEKSSVSCRIT